MERGNQVAQIGNIHSEVESVISWLGPGINETKEIFWAIDTKGACIP
jgi:hypothetical protein